MQKVRFINIHVFTFSTVTMQFNLRKIISVAVQLGDQINTEKDNTKENIKSKTSYLQEIEPPVVNTVAICQVRPREIFKTQWKTDLGISHLTETIHPVTSLLLAIVRTQKPEPALILLWLSWVFLMKELYKVPITSLPQHFLVQLYVKGRQLVSLQTKTYDQRQRRPDRGTPVRGTVCLFKIAVILPDSILLYDLEVFSEWLKCFIQCKIRVIYIQFIYLFYY